MTPLTADAGRYRPTGQAGPPVGHALVAFAVATLVLLTLVGADVADAIDLPGGASSQFGIVATTTFAIAGVAASYRAWTVRNIGAAAMAGLLLGPGAAWSWMTFVGDGRASSPVNSLVVPVACGMAMVLLVKGIRRRCCLEVFGGLGSLVVGMVAALVRLDPETAGTPSSALLASVAGLICLYGLLAELEASEHRSLAELLESRREIEAEVSRVEDLLHDLRSGLLAIETAIGSFDDDIAAPLRAEAARLRRLTLTGARTVGLFDVAGSVRNLVDARRATGADVVLRGPQEEAAWGEESEILAIVENLLSNAERHGRSGRIVVEISHDAGGTRVAVSSPGRLEGGDPEAVVTRGVTTHPEGKGSGLARARLLAVVNGADLRVAPAGTGRTTFVLTLRSQPPVAVA
jgi:signal transduction histidine kinase